jgi:hypothetical protein
MTAHDDAPLLCGTYAGFQRHLRANETPCEECKAARTLYVRQWRERGGMTRTRQYNAARGRALTRLAANHRAEYRALYREELGVHPEGE